MPSSTCQERRYDPKKPRRQQIKAFANLGRPPIDVCFYSSILGYVAYNEEQLKNPSEYFDTESMKLAIENLEWLAQQHRDKVLLFYSEFLVATKREAQAMRGIIQYVEEESGEPFEGNIVIPKEVLPQLQDEIKSIFSGFGLVKFISS